MSRLISLAGGALVLSLGACSETGVTGAVTELTGADACGAAERQAFVGQRVDALNDVELPDDTRVLFPGAAVTQDLRPDRLNITIGGDETITEVYCG